MGHIKHKVPEIGEKFEMLTFLGFTERKQRNGKGQLEKYGLFKCDCGNEKEMVVRDVVQNGTRSCGCVAREIWSRVMHTGHHNSYKYQGDYVFLDKRIYDIWSHMHYRCEKPTSDCYENYGGRGIVVCEEWGDFQKFKKWAHENGYSDKLQIDRIDNNGNYEPTNCQWITGAENNGVGKKRMMSTNKSGYNGVSWSSTYKKWVVSISVNSNRINLGLFKTLDDAVQSRIKSEIEHFGKQMTNFHYKKGDDISEIINTN